MRISDWSSDVCSSDLMSEETFGPVAPVVAFDTVDEVIGRANDVPYGLAAYAFTRSAATAMAVADGLQAGMVGINTPAISLAEASFGGVKESGDRKSTRLNSSQ